MATEIFNINRIAEASGFRNGCGLHAFIDFLCINIQEGKLTQAQAKEGLDLLLPKFKERYYPAANELDAEALWKLLNELTDPIHRTFVLGDAMRQCLTREDQRVPGTFVSDDQIQILANKFGIEVESYATLEARAITRYPDAKLTAEELEYFHRKYGRRNPSYEDTLEFLYARMAQEYIIAHEGRAAVTEDNILRRIGLMKAERAVNNLRLTEQKVAADAPVFQMVNAHGRHWQRVCNQKKTAAENEADCKRHQEQFYGKGDTLRRHHLFEEIHHAAAVEEVKACLKKRKDRGARSMSDTLSDYERWAAQYEHHKRFHSGSGSKATSSGTPGSGTPSTTAAVDPNNPLSRLTNVVQQAGQWFTNQSNEGLATGNLFGLIFGFFTQALNFVSGLIPGFMQGLKPNASQQDSNHASRPLEVSETKTDSDKLFAKFVEALPKRADAVKKQLRYDWRNNVRPKQELFKELKAAFLEQDCIPQYQSLAFNLGIRKLDPRVGSSLHREYHLSRGSSKVWRKLRDALYSARFDEDALEISQIMGALPKDKDARHVSFEERKERSDSETAEAEGATTSEPSGRKASAEHKRSSEAAETQTSRRGSASETSSTRELKERMEKVAAETAERTWSEDGDAADEGDDNDDTDSQHSAHSDDSAETAVTLHPQFDASKMNRNNWYAPDPLLRRPGFNPYV